MLIGIPFICYLTENIHKIKQCVIVKKGDLDLHDASLYTDQSKVSSGQHKLRENSLLVIAINSQLHPAGSSLKYCRSIYFFGGEPHK